MLGPAPTPDAGGIHPPVQLSKRYEMTWAYAIDQMKLVKSAMKQRNAGDYDRMDKEIQVRRTWIADGADML